MTPDIARKRVRIKRQKPFLTHIAVSAVGTNEYGEPVHGGFVKNFHAPIQWSPDEAVVFRTQAGNFIISISCAKIKRWPRKKKT